MSTTPEELIERARAGDAPAAADLVAQTYERIFAFFRRLAGNEADARDLTQKTFAKVWRSLGSYRARSSVSTWMHGIGYHVYADWRRRENRLEAKSDEWWEACAAAGPSPFEDAAERDLAGHLYALVEQLPEEARELVHLHYYQGLSLQECAEVLGVAASTVKYRLRGTLDRLKTMAAETPRSQPQGNYE